MRYMRSVHSVLISSSVFGLMLGAMTPAEAREAGSKAANYTSRAQVGGSQAGSSGADLIKLNTAAKKPPREFPTGFQPGTDKDSATSLAEAWTGANASVSVAKGQTEAKSDSTALGWAIGGFTSKRPNVTPTTGMVAVNDQVSTTAAAKFGAVTEAKATYTINGVTRTAQIVGGVASGVGVGPDETPVVTRIGNRTWVEVKTTQNAPGAPQITATANAEVNAVYSSASASVIFDHSESVDKVVGKASASNHLSSNSFAKATGFDAYADSGADADATGYARTTRSGPNKVSDSDLSRARDYAVLPRDPGTPPGGTCSSMQPDGPGSCKPKVIRKTPTNVIRARG